MKHMCRGIRKPNFCLPANIPEVSCHVRLCRKGSDIDYSGGAGGEEFRQFIPALGVNRSVTCYSLNQNNPVFCGIINDHVWHLAVRVNHNTKCGKTSFVEVSPFIASIADIQDYTSRCESRAEFIDYFLDEMTVFSRRKLNG